MATTAITGTDLALLRADNQYIDDVALHITPRVAVATGTVTSVPTLSPYVQVGITWDSGFSGVAVGQLLEIVSGSTLKTYGVVRKAPTSSILYISTTPLGSAGYATDIENVIAVNDTVTVYSHHPLWGLPSRIANRTFFKMWDVAYTNQNSQPPPVANAGTWQAAKVSSGATASFTLPRAGSNTSFALGSATISSHLWTLPSGVALQAGYATSDSVIEVDADAGYHLITYTVTDSNAKTHTAYVWLFVSDGTTGTSLSERYTVEIVSDNQTPEGRTMDISITGENLNDVIYPGAGILFREWAKYNGQDLSDGVGIDTFIGYISDLKIDHDGNIGTANLTIESPYQYANRITVPSQVVEETASPANWTQATSALTNPRGFLYYMLKWHAPAMLDMHDLDAPYTTPRRKNAAWQAGSVSTAMKQVADYIAGSIGSVSDGTTVLREKPVYMDNTDRNALVNIITWLDRDLQLPYTYVKRFNQALSEARTGAFAYDGTTIKAWLAGKFWGQGTGSATLSNFVVTVSEGLPRVLEVVGHFYAEQNRDILEIPLTLTMNQDIIDPAYWLWCSLTTSSDFDTLGNGFTSQRCLATNITREWFNGNYGLEKTLQIGLQPETFGQPGEEIPIQNAKTYQVNGYSNTIPSNFTPNQNDSAFGGASVMVVNNEAGKLAITYNYQASSPAWNDLTASLNDETVHDFCVDYNSAYFANGNNASYALGLYAVTSSDTTLNVWYFSDILTSYSAEIIQTETMNDDSNTSNARIEVSETTPTLAIVAWHDRTGTSYIRTTDGGSNWSTQANIGSSVTDTSNDNASLGLDIDASKQLVTAPDGSSQYGAYVATSGAGGFTRLASTPASSTPYPMIKIRPGTDDAYISAGAGATYTHTVTFDAGTDSYSVSGTSISTAETTGGNTGNCLVGTATPSVNGSRMWVEIDFGSNVAITDIQSDLWALTGNGSLRAQLELDGVAVGSGSISGVGATSTWFNSTSNSDYDYNDMFTSPIIGQVLRVIWGTTSVYNPFEIRMDNIIVQYQDITESTSTVTFDTGGASYTAGGVGASPTVTTGGNPDNCLGSGTWSAVSNDAIYVDVNFGSPVTVTEITLDMWANSNNCKPFVDVDPPGSTISGTYQTSFSIQPGDLSSWVNSNSDPSGFPPVGGYAFTFAPITGTVFRVGLYHSTTTAGVQVKIDNIAITTGSGGSNTDTLYDVTDFDGTDTWTDISPVAGESPTRPHDLAPDILNSNTANMHIASSGKWYSTANGGSSWTTQATSTDKRVFFTSGTAKAAGGTNKVSLTLDGSTYEDKTGNLSSAIGSIGAIKRVQAL